MKRKVIKQGNGTLTITLPKQWTEKIGLKGGDEIEVKEEGGSIAINPKNREETRTINLDLEDLSSPRAVRWVLSALHKNGFDEIELTYNNPGVAKIIQSEIKNIYTGFAVMDQSEKRTVMRAISRDVYDELEPSLRRAFLVTLSLIEGLGKKMRSNDFNNIQELIALEKSNNQFTNFCERILLKKGYLFEEKLPLKYLIIWNLEKVCDVYKDLCEHIEERRIKSVSKQVISLYDEVASFFRSFYETVYTFDIKKFDRLQEEEKRVTQKLKNLKPFKKDEYELIFFLRNIAERTLNFSGPLIGLNLKGND